MEEVQTTDSQATAELIDAVRKQIEYYFSKENLQSDVYLISQMDAQMSVPLNVVMKFAKLKALTTDESIVRKAVENSSVAIFDNRIRSIVKPTGSRSTIILRDIPSDAPEEEVKEIFNFEGCKPISSIRSDIGDTWFVVLDSEEDAKQTALDLRLKKRTFRGQAVKSRIKTEQVVRSYYPIPPPAAIPSMFPILPFPAPMMNTPLPLEMMPPFTYMGIPPIPPVDGMFVTPDGMGGLPESDGAHEGDNVGDSGNGESNRSRPPRDPSRSSRNDGRNKGAKVGGKAVIPASGITTVIEIPADSRRKSDGKRSSGKDGRGRGSADSKPPIEVNAINFPPLNAIEETPIPVAGYTGSFLSYTTDEVIAIVKHVQDATLPKEVNLKEHSLALQAEPNLDLLKRQRTFTIDETREQLRQGKPVQREAIVSGSVDYKVLHYGDVAHSSTAKAESAKAPAPGGTAPAPSATVVASGIASISLETEKAGTGANVKASPFSEVEGAAPGSPPRITASTWAAMIKSAPDVPAPQTNAPAKQSPGKPAAVTVPADTSSRSKSQPASKDSDKAKRSSSEAGSTSENQTKEQSNNNNNRRNKGKDSKKPSAESNSTTEQDEKSKATLEESKPSATAAAPAAGGGWGGKSSFASVLKQVTDDSDNAVPSSSASSAAVAPPAKKAGNSSNGGNSSGKSSGAKQGAAGSGSSKDNKERNQKGGDNNSSRDNQRGGKGSDRNSGDSKRATAADTDGVWRRGGSLPPLPEK